MSEIRTSGRTDMLSRNINNQGLLSTIADLEKRVDALEKQWRRAVQVQGASGTSTDTQAAFARV